MFYENRIIKISRHVCIDVLTCNCLHLSNVRTETEKVKKYFSILPTLKTVFIYNQCILFLEVVQQLCHVGRLLATKIHTVLCLVLGLRCPPPGPAPGRWSRSRNLGNVGISLGSQGSGPSLKYEDCRHSSAVALFVGSYLEIKYE